MDKETKELLRQLNSLNKGTNNLLLAGYERYSDALFELSFYLDDLESNDVISSFAKEEISSFLIGRIKIKENNDPT